MTLFSLLGLIQVLFRLVFAIKSTVRGEYMCQLCCVRCKKGLLKVVFMSACPEMTATKICMSPSVMYNVKASYLLWTGPVCSELAMMSLKLSDMR